MTPSPRDGFTPVADARDDVSSEVRRHRGTYLTLAVLSILMSIFTSLRTTPKAVEPQHSQMGPISIWGPVRDLCVDAATAKFRIADALMSMVAVVTDLPLKWPVGSSHTEGAELWPDQPYFNGMPSHYKISFPGQWLDVSDYDMGNGVDAVMRIRISARAGYVLAGDVPLSIYIKFIESDLDVGDNPYRGFLRPPINVSGIASGLPIDVFVWPAAKGHGTAIVAPFFPREMMEITITSPWAHATWDTSVFGGQLIEDGHVKADFAYYSVNSTLMETELERCRNNADD